MLLRKPSRLTGCEFSSCPGGSPATGSNTLETRLNYVNSDPVASIKTGISTSGPKLWNGAKHNIALTVPNVGNSIWLQVPFSGTVGAAVYAAQTAKIPAIAFSGSTGTATAWNQPTPLYSEVYADLALNITNTILDSGTPYLYDDVWLNVKLSRSQFDALQRREPVQVRAHQDQSRNSECKRNTEWCGIEQLPTERSIESMGGCYVSISPGDAFD